MKNSIQVVVVEPKAGDIILHSVENTLEALQKLIGGYIEAAALPQLRDHKIEMLADEEGVLKCLPINENLNPYFYVGRLVFVGTNGENFTSLNDNQLKYIQFWLRELRVLR